MAQIYKPCSTGRNGSTSPLDPARCKAGVWAAGRRMWYSQCSRKAGADGWCATHHPDAEAKREAASDAKYKARLRSDAMGQYGEGFMAALIAIRDGDNDPRETARKALEGCKYADPA